MCGVLEHSITACLYFLPPHRMKKVDLILMAAISRMVRKILCYRPPLRLFWIGFCCNQACGMSTAFCYCILSPVTRC